MTQLFKKKFRTLRSHLERYGPAETAWLLVAQPLEDLGALNIGHCYALDLHHALPPETPPRNGVEVRELTRAEIDELASRGQDWFFPRAVEESISRGDRCFGVFVDEALACSNWCTVQPLHQFGLRLSCSDDGLFEYRVFTAPEFRGRRLQRILRDFVTRTYRDDGFRWYLNTMYSTNSASIRAAKKYGFQRIGTIVRIGSLNGGRAWLFSRDPARLWVG